MNVTNRRLALLTPVLLLTALSFDASAQRRVGGIADVSIYDRENGRELPLYEHRGRWYVPGKPGHEYEIRVRNNDSRRVLAVTSVDGVNVITGQTATPDQSGYVVNRYGTVEIDGWRKSMSHVARFYFTDLPDSYAARTDRPDNVGVIGVALFPERETRYYPYGRPESQDRDSYGERGAAPRSAPVPEAKSAEPQLGTGHGREDGSDARYTDFVRESSRPAEVITIYYDTHRNLVAAGVIPPRENEWAYRDRPQPFPGHFVPDPWRR